MMTMNANEFTKQALDLQKGTFASWYDAMSIVQDQVVLAVDKLLDQTAWIPDEDRQVISRWVGTCKNERDRYKVYMEESFSVIENHLAQKPRDAPVKPAEPAAEAKSAAPSIKAKDAAVEEKMAPDAQGTKQSVQS
jgi:hypothetical protein